MVGRHTLVAMALVTIVLLAGCGSLSGSGAAPGTAMEAANGADSGGSGGAPASTPMATAAQEPHEEDQAGGGDSKAFQNDKQANVQTAIIRTGTIDLRVDDFDATRDALSQMARNMGGFVSDSGQKRHREGNLTWQTGYVVVRVPKAEFSNMLAEARAEGTVRSESTAARDVSDQLVDIEARLSNLQAKRDRLRDFYDRANETSELLRIEERLSEVQGEIERLKAKKQSLQDKVAFSTLRIELSEPRPTTPTPTPSPTPTPKPAYHETSLTTAFTQSINTVVVFAKSGVVTAAYLLPYGLAVSPLLAGLLLVRRRRNDADSTTDSRQLIDRDRTGSEEAAEPDDDEPN